MSENKKKVGIIVQRYGAQINGGSEALAKMIAEKLTGKYDVTVLTSRAIDYHEWEPVLKKGIEYENGVKIIRFDHGMRKVLTPAEIHLENRKSRGRFWYQKLYRLLGKPKWYRSLIPGAEAKGINEKRWIELQGPYIKELVPYLKKNADSFAAYIFLTYIFYPAASGMPEVGSKSIFIPTMHDEPAAHMPVFQGVMRSPAYIFFLTEAEKAFSKKTFDIVHIPSKVISVGIDVPSLQPDPAAIARFNITGKYILYLGRIEPHKGCVELLEYFLAFNKKYPGRLQLVMAGRNTMDAVDDPAVIYAGFVSEEEKWQLLKQAEALVLSSRYESLSLVLLESFACKVPVIASAYSEVLKNHIAKSNGGWAYTDYDSFEKALEEVIAGDNLAGKGAAGYEYVKQNYSWEKVMKEFDDTISFIEDKNKIGKHSE